MCSRCALLLVWGESINSGECDYLSQWVCRDGFPRRVLPWWQRDASHALSGACGSICSHLRDADDCRKRHTGICTLNVPLVTGYSPQRCPWIPWGILGKHHHEQESTFSCQQGDGVSWGKAVAGHSTNGQLDILDRNNRKVKGWCQVEYL